MIDHTNIGFVVPWALILGMLALSVCASADGGPRKVIVDIGEELGPSDVEGLLGVQASGRWAEESPSRKAWVEGVFKHVRGHYLDPGVEVRDCGECGEPALELDFDRVDRKIGAAQSLNMVPGGFTFAMPQVLSSKPDAERYDDEVKDHFTMYAPADYRLWEEYVRRSVEHIVEKWGLAGAYYEVFNEPESSSDYWLGKPGSTDYMGAALEMYVHTARAIKAADPTARVGGPASCHWKVSAPEIGGSWGVEEFLAALDEYNRAHPEAPAPLDFISWHDYAWASPRLLDGADYIDRVVAELNWPTGREYLITEWNLTFGQEDGLYTAQQFSSHAAYNVLTIAAEPRRRIVRLYFYSFDFYAGEHVSLVDGPDPWSPPSGKTHTWARGPSYAVFQMARTLHGGNLVRVAADDPVVALAAKQDDRVRLMINNNTAEQVSARIELKGLAEPAADWQCRLQQVDDEHSSDGKGLEAGTDCELSERDGAAFIEYELRPYGTALFTLSEKQ